MLADDVEALMVRVPDDAEHRRGRCYLVPIDACYEFVGRTADAVARLRRRPGGTRSSSDEFFERCVASAPGK